MKIKPFFRWYDLWIGIYLDIESEAIYICPVPMFGIVISLPPSFKVEQWQIILRKRFRFGRGSFPSFSDSKIYIYWRIGPLEIRHWHRRLEIK